MSKTSFESYIVGVFFYCAIRSEYGTQHNMKCSWKLSTVFRVVPEVVYSLLTTTENTANTIGIF